MKNRFTFTFILFITLFCISFMSCKSTLFVPKYKGKSSSNFDGEKFHNHHDSKMGSFTKLFWYQMTNKKGKWNYQENAKRMYSLDYYDNQNLRYTHINHATVLIQLKSVNILTDPVFVKRASPFQFMGPKRYRKPAISLEELPKIDFVIISHDHYDHLDIESIKKIQSRDGTKILVGLGLKSFLEGFDIKNVFEFDWKQSQSFDGTEFVFHTAKHWSNRSVQPYRSLWGAWIIKGGNATIYYAGDTGYGDHFKEIKSIYKNIELALIPIGAYKPRFFMQHVHMAPEDAVKAHIDLDPQESLAIHWGTFQLTHEAMFDPINELDSLSQKQGILNFYYDKEHNKTFEIKLN